MDESIQKDLFERRRQPRVRVPVGQFCVVTCGSGEKLGTLLDIGRGGLAFRYIPNGEPLTESFKLNILAGESRVFLSGVPYVNISDFEMGDRFYFRTSFMRRRGLQFKELTSHQLSLVEFLIQESLRVSHYDGIFIPQSTNF